MSKSSTRLLTLTIFSTFTLSCSHDHQNLGMLSSASRSSATSHSLNHQNQDRLGSPLKRINLADLDLLTMYQYIYEDRIVNEMDKLLTRHHLQPNVRNKNQSYITPADPTYDSKVQAFSTAFQNQTLPIDDELLLALHLHHPIRVIGNDQPIDLKLLSDTLVAQIKKQLILANDITSIHPSMLLNHPALYLSTIKHLVEEAIQAKHKQVFNDFLREDKIINNLKRQEQKYRFFLYYQAIKKKSMHYNKLLFKHLK